MRGDDRGSLISLEAATGVPFDIRRVYYIFGTGPGVVRGLHAHTKLRQWAICVAGSCTITLDDGQLPIGRPGSTRPTVHSKSDRWCGGKCAISRRTPSCWCSPARRYDEEDYIRDYQDFLGQVGA